MSTLRWNRPWTRRQLLRGIGAASVGAVGASALAACASPSAAPAAPATGAGAQPTSAPRVGGEIRIDATADPISIDPLRFNGTDSLRVYRMTTNQLLKWREDGSVVPDLAAALPTVSPDLLTYTFRLKPGVKWHDGQPFDAADVKFTYETILKPDVPSIWKAALVFLDSVEAPDAQTVVFRMKSRFNAMMAKFALVPIISSKIPYTPNDTYARRNIGTGPFRFVEWQTGVQIVLERNPDYFEQGKPYVQRLIIRTVKEDAARVTNLINGQTQLVPDAPMTQRDVMTGRGAIVDVAQNSTIRVALYPSLKAGDPTATVAMREAIAWALDRQAIIDNVYNGAAVPAATYLSSGTQYFDEKLGTFFGNRPDLAKARAALQRAGGPPVRELNYVINNSPAANDIATIVQANLRAIGVNVKIIADEGGAYTDKLFGGDFDLIMVIAGTGSSSGFAPDYVYNGYYSKSGNNFNKSTDAEMDRLLERAISVPDSEAQAAWRAVQERDLQILGQIQVVTARYVEGRSRTIQNYRASGLATPYGLPDAWLS
ncbi:MAG: diguanylate phosphodiesterase [Dehalococcoidia bacterium]|nr:MAG: diguanylate phosphodiesterase [Dehalococcoidia bacterium]